MPEGESETENEAPSAEGVLAYEDDTAREAAAASTLLAAYFEGRDDPTARTDDDRRALADVIAAGAWSDAAWRALEFQRTR